MPKVIDINDLKTEFKLALKILITTTNLPKTIISIPSRINEYTSNNLCAEDCKGNKNRSILDGRKFWGEKV